MKKKTTSLIDTLITKFDENLRAITGSLAPTKRLEPTENIAEVSLTSDEKQHAAGLMRVNHTGEVCAQALYLGQSMVANSKKIKQELKHCAEEEVDHLYWCQKRVHQLGSHVSYLNPLWFGGSFILGVVAGLTGDKWNLGFLAETENQVGAHLDRHLQKLPTADLPSQAIVKQMREDEAKHAETAIKFGAATLPTPIKQTMQLVSKVMTKTVYYL